MGELAGLGRYNEDGTVIWYELSEYDENGNRVKETDYDADGTIYWIKEYGGNGNLIE